MEGQKDERKDKHEGWKVCDADEVWAAEEN